MMKLEIDMVKLDGMQGLLCYYRVPTLPGKPGIQLFSFPGLEKAWNLLKKW